jgi:putative transcriptional regulator
MLLRMGRKPKEETPVFNRLEEVRESRGLTRMELAYGADVHYQTIGYIERGEYSPSLSLALTLAKILRTEVHEIFSLEPFTRREARQR